MSQSMMGMGNLPDSRPRPNPMAQSMSVIHPQTQKQSRPILKSKIVPNSNEIFFYFPLRSNTKVFPNLVTVTGSWCGWQMEYPMTYKPLLMTYYLSIREDYWKHDKIVYKFKVDGKWKLNLWDKVERTWNEDLGGDVENNVIQVYG